jgi:hypothetical protein
VERVESIRVTWPDGANVTLHDPPVRKVIEVPYPHR